MSLDISKTKILLNLVRVALTFFVSGREIFHFSSGRASGNYLERREKILIESTKIFNGNAIAQTAPAPKRCEPTMWAPHSRHSVRSP